MWERRALTDCRLGGSASSPVHGIVEIASYAVVNTYDVSKWRFLASAIVSPVAHESVYRYYTQPLK